MAGIKQRFFGVDFVSIQYALCSLYFEYEGMTPEAFDEALKFVIPMQHNFELPIKEDSQDTYIQFWIDSDDRLTQDYKQNGQNIAKKVASVTVRFLGAQAESWAKMFHHLTQRKSVESIFAMYCHGKILDYVNPILPINIDYFNTGNTMVAFTTAFQIAYDEVFNYLPEPEAPAERLKYISLADGDVSDRMLIFKSQEN